MRPELLDTVTDLVTPLLTGARVIVGLVGPPGAGKSTLADALVARLGAAGGAARPGRAPRPAGTVPLGGVYLFHVGVWRLGVGRRQGGAGAVFGWGCVA